MGRWARKPVNHTSWVAVVTPTDRPKSIRNLCLIELFCGVVCVVTLPFWLPVGVGAFVIGLSQISSFFSYLDLLLSIRREVNFTLPFMTNMTISIPKSQALRFWVAIFHLRTPMVFLSRSSCDMLGLAPRVDVLFWWQRYFQISYSYRDKARTARNRHWGRSIVDTEIFSDNMKFFYHKC